MATEQSGRESSGLRSEVNDEERSTNVESDVGDGELREWIALAWDELDQRRHTVLNFVITR